MKKTALLMFIGFLGTLVVATAGPGEEGDLRVPVHETPSGPMLSVRGPVKRPGPVAFRPGMTLLQAVQAAGGVTEFGSRQRIFLTRRNARIRLDLRKAWHQSYPVEPGDRIEVDQKGRHFWR